MLDDSRILAVLRGAEWTQAFGSMGGYCPICEGHHLSGHKPDCELAALISEAQSCTHPEGYRMAGVGPERFETFCGKCHAKMTDSRQHEAPEPAS